MIPHDSVGWLGPMWSWLGLPIGQHPTGGGLGWKPQESLSHTSEVWLLSSTWHLIAQGLSYGSMALTSSGWLYDPRSKEAALPPCANLVWKSPWTRPASRGWE